jgi:hypothetical protein
MPAPAEMLVSRGAARTSAYFRATASASVAAAVRVFDD